MGNDYVTDKIGEIQIIFKNGEGIYVISPTNIESITFSQEPQYVECGSVEGHYQCFPRGMKFSIEGCASALEIAYTPASDNISEQIESQELDQFLESFRKRGADGTV